MQEKELKISEIKGRFLQFLDKQNISVYKFSTESGISKSNFSGKSLESELGGEQISKILTYFPNLNPEWLLLGIGEMLRSEPPKPAPEGSRSDEIWKEILAEKDRRIEELIIENYKIREQVAKIQAITPPPLRNGLINKALHIGTSDTSEPGNDNPKKQ